MKTTKMSLATMAGKLSRAEMKNVAGGITFTPVWTCTMKFTNGTTGIMTFPNTGSASGTAAQCLSDYACLQNDSCKTVDCAGSPPCR